MSSVDLSSVLMDERPILFLPRLAKILGSCERAIVLQQIRWLLTQEHSGVDAEGYHWVWGSYEEWCRNYFTMWSPHTLRKHIQRLEKDGYLISAQLRAHQHDQTKFYRIDGVKLAQSMRPEPIASMRPDAVASDRPDAVASSITESSTEKEKEIVPAVPEPAPPVLSEQKPTAPAKERDPTPNALMMLALSACLLGHEEYGTWTDKQKAHLGKTSKHLRDDGITPDELRVWLRTDWSHEWPGKIGERPTHDQLMAAVGRILEKRKVKPNGYIEEFRSLGDR